MRRTGLIVVIYSILAFAVCLLISNFLKNLPILVEGDERTYVLLRGFLYFCRFLPALVFSSFLIGCAISYGKDSEKAKVKYSPFIMNHFKKTMITSILIVLCVSLVTEVFVPLFENHQARAQSKPALYSEFINLSREYYDKGNMNLALEYSYNALLLNPKSTDALYINEHASAALNSLKMVREKPEDFADSEQKETLAKIPEKEIQGETVTSLLKKAQDAAQKEKWFDAHYYAYLALAIGNKTDINFQDASLLAGEAWNHLFDPTEIKETAAQILFKKKLEAYRTFIRGDNIEAYYLFLEIANYSDVAARDPDVVKFLALAAQRVENQCFYIEEVENLRRFETHNNVYFSIPHDDGSRDVVFIRGITPIKNSGGLVQYLRGLSIFTYAKDGKFFRSIYVPYAKMLSERVSKFDEIEKSRFGLKDSFKSVPYLMLESISKTSREGRMSPVYEYDAEYIKKNEPFLNSYFILALPQTDFNLLCSANAGSNNMNLVSLMRFLSKTRDYGYSYEVYNSDFIYRLTYPLVLLVCCIFMACMAWNYRLKDEQLFKFKWIFIIPFLTAILYFFFQFGLYAYRLLIYALVVMLQGGAVYATAGILVLALIIVSFIFVSRKAD